jgi:mannose-6-phosphate isomerase-like protein (cupin superfamily)
MELKMTRLEGFVKKGWGHELIWATNDQYCGKVMVFDKAGAKFSMHFHREKDETWIVTNGEFILRYIDTNTACINEKVLKRGDTWRNPPLMPHQLEAVTDDATVFEVSTPDSVEDNYRIMPGDSQIISNNTNL